jgi:hypothetical protein
MTFSQGYHFSDDHRPTLPNLFRESIETYVNLFESIEESVVIPSEDCVIIGIQCSLIYEVDRKVLDATRYRVDLPRLPTD